MDADPPPDAGTMPSPGHLLGGPLLPAEPVLSAQSDDLPGEPHVPQEAAPSIGRRIGAVAEVLLCSGYPTQVAVGLLLWFVGHVGPGQKLTLSFLALLVAIDTVAIVGLVWFFLRAGGERPADTLFGRRRLFREAWLGASLLPAVFAIVATAAIAIARFAPWLRQDDNPFAALVHSPADAAVLALVGVVGGGVREEVQRAFILHRFEQYLGGARVGLVLFSVLFGLLHALQGWAAAIITGLLGAFWGLVYLWRRSIVAPVVSHAVFNLVETLVFLRR